MLWVTALACGLTRPGVAVLVVRIAQRSSDTEAALVKKALAEKKGADKVRVVGRGRGRGAMWERTSES